MSLLLKTTEIWPFNAKKIIMEKNINIIELKLFFTNIFFPWDPNYDYERNYYSIRIQQRPLFIIQPINCFEIEQILNYCAEKNLTIRICNGRHSTQLLSPEVLVDMSLMDKIKLSCTGTKVSDLKVSDLKVSVQGGATQGMVNDFLFRESGLNCYSHFGHFIRPGRTSPELSTGSAESVGITGISTIGGVGNLRRLYGLTIDSIESYIITIPPNKSSKSVTIKASENSNPDLFYALLGGGANNFGIVSEITYKLFNVGNLIEYSINWNWNNAEQVLNLWQKTSITRPNEFTEEINIVKNNNLVSFSLLGFYVIPPTQSYPDAINYVKKTIEYLGGNQIISEPKQYSDIYLNLVKSRIYYNFSIIQALFTNSYNSNQIINLIEQSQVSDGKVSIGIELLGGAIKDYSSGCFGFRNSNFFIDISSAWNNLEDSQNQEFWTGESTNSLISNGIDGAYLGFPISFTNIKYNNSIYYSNSYNKLTEIKHKYDPENILSYSGTL